MLERRLSISLLALTLLLCTTHPLVAEDVQASPKASIDDLGWIAGDWTGKQGDSVVEEQWSAAGGGAMMGMFRWLADGEVRLYEFLLIETAPQGLVMRFKHFGPGLVGWEAKEESLEFHLESLEDDRAVFAMDPEIEDTRLVYELEDGGNGLTVSLIKTAEGKESVTRFDYARR